MRNSQQPPNYGAAAAQQGQPQQGQPQQGQPPRYGAEGPPGGANQWAQARAALAQGSQGRLGQFVRERMPGWQEYAAQQLRDYNARPTAPQSWADVPRTQWGQPPQNMQQGMPPQGQPPQGMPSQGQPPQGMQQGMPQQGIPQKMQGMAGLGRAGRGLYDTVRANALRQRSPAQE